MHRKHHAHDALNDYLDAHVGVTPPNAPAADLDADLQDDVDRFLALAQQANMTTFHGRNLPMSMHTAARLPQSALPVPPSMAHLTPLHTGMPGRRSWLNAGLSTLVVALMLIGIVGGAWWFGPGPVGPADDPPLQLAAITNDESTPDAYWPEPLNPVDDPWIATITPEECTAEPISWEKYSAAAATDPGLPDSSFEIVGNPDPEDAEAVVAVLRSWLACADYGNKDQVRTFYTQEALFFKDVSMYNAPYQGEIERRKVEAEQSLARWARESGLYPLSIIAGVEPPEDALVSFEYAQQMLQDSDAMHTGSIVVSPEGTTVPYVEVRFDPADAVLLADGRIMIPTRYVYWAEDPWVQANGFPSEINSSSMAMVLRQVDEEWRIDQTFSIYVCAGGCDYSLIGTDTWPSATPVS